MTSRLNLSPLFDKIDLVDLAEQSGARLRKSGSEMRSACPLHGGNNPTAFSITAENDGRQYWHCYTTCSDGGDAIDFIRRWHNLEFMLAVRWLADHCGVSLTDLNMTPEVAQAEAEKRRRSGLLNVALGWYVEQLWLPAGEQGLAYARSRLTDAALKRGRWGYSPGATALRHRLATGLRDYLAELDADLDLARKIGLIRADGLDFTANAGGEEISPAGWLIYPHLHAGRVEYLSARALNPEAEGGDKSRNLPGPKQVYRAEAPGDRKVILVEGQADAETLRALGHSAWALCGASLNESDICVLRRRKAVYLALDGDEAGQQGVERLAPEIGPLAMIVPALPQHHKDFNDWFQAEAEAHFGSGMPEGDANDDKSAKLADMLHEAGSAMPNEIAKLLADSTPWIGLAIKQAKDCPPFEEQDRLEQLADLVNALPASQQGKYAARVRKALGIPARDFKRLLRSRTEQKGQQNGRVPLADVREGQLCYLGEPMLNCDVRITHELTQDDGENTPTKSLTLVGQMPGGAPLEPINIPAEEFAGLRWIPKHWGTDVLVHPPPGRHYLVTKAIQEISMDDKKRERLHLHTGWTILNGRSAFLAASGAITPDGFDADVRVDLGHARAKFYALPDPSDISEQGLQDDPSDAFAASLGFLDLVKPEVSVPIWAAMHAAAITSWHSLNAVMWVYGDTQSGKSTLTHLALTHYGPHFIKGREYQSPMDWTFTYTTIEGVLFRAKDVPVVIDDYAPQHVGAAAARRMADKANTIVRVVGNRSYRGRSRADLSERQARPPRGLVIATAEDSLHGESVVGRMIYVPVARGEVPFSNDGDGPVDRAQEQAGKRGLYARATTLHLHRIAQNFAAIQEHASALVEQANENARSIFPSTQSRLGDYYAVLYAGARLFLESAHHYGAIDRREVARLDEEIRDALLGVLHSQSERVAGQSPVKRYFQALSALLATKQVYLEARTGSDSYGPPAPNSEHIGYHDIDRPVMYLLPETAIGVVKGYWERAGEYFAIAGETLNRMAWQAGVIPKRGKSQFTSSEYCRGGTQRVLIIDAEKVWEKYHIALLPSVGASDDPEEDEEKKLI